MPDKDVKIGILVVYYLDPSEEWVIQEHFRRLEACYKKQFKIYAAFNRLCPDLHHYLADREYLQAQRLPSTDLRGSLEHIWYLDQLKSIALKDGCDYICTLDVDSWPLKEDFFECTINLLRESGVELMAIQREENGDSYLPHPSFIFASANLFRVLDLHFGAPAEKRDASDYKRFSADTKQTFDTGIGVAYKLWRHNTPWLKVLRSNAIDYHFLMGGIYGGLIFHVGSSSRVKRFRAEGRHWTKKIGEILRSIPLVSTQAKRIVFWLEKVFPDRVSMRNSQIYETIRKELTSNPLEFYNKLLGLKDSSITKAPHSGSGKKAIEEESLSPQLFSGYIRLS